MFGTQTANATAPAPMQASPPPPTREPNPKRLAREQARRRERAALMERLSADGDTDLAEILEKCAQIRTLKCCHCGHCHKVETRCKKRWCPSCAYFVSVERVNKYAALADKFQWPLFVTLTVKNSIDPEGLRTLKKQWSKFRRRKIISRQVRSGIVGFEVTNIGNGWHPHIHALLDCRWLSIHIPEPTRNDNATAKAAKCRAAAEELQTVWAKQIGQPSASVAVRRADSVALIEVLKYAVKPQTLAESKERPGDIIRVMQGMRMMTTFGAIRKKVEDQDTEAPDDTSTGMPCPECGEAAGWIPEEVFNRILLGCRDKRNGR